MPGKAEPRGSVRLGAYLRRLREGYGYTLRRVEERTSSLGDPIDNSQLSRFEKGKASPSFEKLRTLARVFSIPVQQFADILDLERYDDLKPATADTDFLLAEGKREFRAGAYGKAYGMFERCLETCEEKLERDADGRAVSRAEDVAVASEARLFMAYALKALGKLGMAEQELRTTLRQRHRLPPKVQLRSLTLLAQSYREQGDCYLATVMAREALEIASEQGDLPVQLTILNTLGNVAFDEARFEPAAEYYERALRLAERLGDHREMLAMLSINLGGSLAAVGRADNGAARIRTGITMAREGGFRRPLALGLTRLAEVYLDKGDAQKGLSYVRQSDQVAGRDDEPYNDILFLNAYRVWEHARRTTNAVQERMALGRLKLYRSLIERRFPEVEAFDSFIEGRRTRP